MTRQSTNEQSASERKPAQYDTGVNNALAIIGKRVNV